MTQLHAFQGSPRRVEALESQHRLRPSLHAPVILLHRVVEVLDLANLNGWFPGFLPLFVQVIECRGIGSALRLSANFVFELILPPVLVYQGIDRTPACPETTAERTFLRLKYHDNVV